MILSSKNGNLNLPQILEKYLTESVMEMVVLYLQLKAGETVLMSSHAELSRTPRAMTYNWPGTHPS